MAEKKKILYIVEAMGGGVFTYIVDAKFKQNLVIQGIKDVHSKFDAQRVAKEHEKLFEELVR